MSLRFIKVSPWIPPWLDRLIDFADEPWGTDPFYSIIHGSADSAASWAGYGIGGAIGVAAGGAVAGPPGAAVGGVAGATAGAYLAPIIIEDTALALSEVVHTGELVGVPLDVPGRPPMPVGFTGWTHGGGPATQNLAGGLSNPTTAALQAVAIGGMFSFLRWVIRARGRIG